MPRCRRVTGNLELDRGGREYTGTAPALHGYVNYAYINRDALMMDKEADEGHVESRVALGR